MVQLTEVEDEHFVRPTADFDDDYTDTDSEISTDSEFDPASETLAERLGALRDMVPASTRAWAARTSSQTMGAAGGALSWSGRALWLLTSSVMLFAVPFMLVAAEDAQFAAMENEQRMRELGGDIMTKAARGDVSHNILNETPPSDSIS